MRKCLVFPVLPLFLLTLACASPPRSAPEKMPAALAFDRIEAVRPDRVTLYFHLTAENQRQLPLDIEIRGWRFRLNGEELNAAAALTLEGAAASGARLAAGPDAKIDACLVLELDLGALPEGRRFVNEHEFQAGLSLDAAWNYGSGAPLTGELSAEAVFPRIREPEFTITSIAMMQAELINTRFRVSLRIDNPNLFPVELSSLGYELYGEGRFWADGQEQDVLHIPAGDSAETALFLTMNFINMKRHLLDEIIAMRLVRYRFTGEAEVETAIPWLPRFHMGFDHSGESVVLR
jgi:LEA14-like dessication related protein